MTRGSRLSAPRFLVVLLLVFAGQSCSEESGGGQAATGGLPSSVPIEPVSYDALYVVNGGDGASSSLSVINTETNQLAGTIELRGAPWPHHIDLSADGRRLAVAVPGMDLSGGHGQEMDMPGAVLLLDARTGAVVQTRKLPKMNHNAAFAPNPREIWTAQMTMPGSVLVLDAETLRTRDQIAVGDMPAEITFAPAQGPVYVANSAADTVTLIDPRAKAVIDTVRVGQGPVGAWQAPDDVAYVDNEHDMTVSAVDRRTNTVLYTIVLGFKPGTAQYGPDGLLWVTDADSGHVVLYRRTRRLLTIPTGAGAHAVTFSGDDRRAYVSNEAADTVSVINVRTHRVTATIPVGHKPNGLVWRENRDH